MVNSSATSHDNAALLLEYAEKLEKSLWEIGSRINWVVVFQSALSVTMISVALDLASVSGDLDIVGLRLRLSVPVLVSGGAVAIGCLLMYQLGLTHQEEALLMIVLDIYRTAGLEHWSLSHRIVHPLENPGVVTTIVALMARRGGRGVLIVGRAFVMLVFIGLPLVAQIIVALALGFQRSWFSLGPVVITLVVSVWVTVLYFRPSTMRPHDFDSKPDES